MFVSGGDGGDSVSLYPYAFSSCIIAKRGLQLGFGSIADNYLPSSVISLKTSSINDSLCSPVTL